ncbi:MAG: glycosyltransferase [Rhodospirillales bacterium]
MRGADWRAGRPPRCRRPSLPALYAASDLYVWPAIGEAWGMALLEARAGGAAGCRRGAGGVAAVVAAGSGLLAPAGDAAGFAAAVRQLLDQPHRRECMARRRARTSPNATICRLPAAGWTRRAAAAGGRHGRGEEGMAGDVLRAAPAGDRHVRRAAAGPWHGGAEIDVCVVLGGRRCRRVSFEGCARVLLPPVHAADATFKLLLDDDGNPIDDALARPSRRRPDVRISVAAAGRAALMIELFPFGRRDVRLRVAAAPDRGAGRGASPHPLLAARRCSGRQGEPGARPQNHRLRPCVSALAMCWYTAIRGWCRSRRRFRRWRRLPAVLVYTGYVADEAGRQRNYARSDADDGEVIVSVGGGTPSAMALRAALAARPRSSRLADRPWRG